MSDKCQKCGYEGKDIDMVRENFKDKNYEFKLCSICRKFLPSEKLEEYMGEKVDWRQLESFRKYGENKNIVEMGKKAKEGNIVNRAPYGFRIKEKELKFHPEEKLKVEKIFRDFLNDESNLSSLAKKYGFSVNGIKKILRNFTYIGKVRFNGQIYHGNHEPIISTELFNKTQSKLEKLSIK